MNRLRQKYENEVKNQMVEKFGYKSVMQIPTIDKIVINMGIGDAVSNSKVLDEAVAELALITGQNQLSHVLRNLSLVSVFVKECQSDVKLHYVVSVCMIS